MDDKRAISSFRKKSEIAWNALRKRPLMTGLVVVLFVLTGMLLYWVFWPYNAPEGTGFVYYDGDAQRQIPRTLWDWLGLLIVPIVLAVGALWFNKTQKDRELYFADLAIIEERSSARDVQNQTTLETFYDRMSELLLEHNLRQSDVHSEVRSIAKARTVTVVRSLDTKRNQQLFLFLRESQLLDPDNPVLDLSGANLSHTRLSNVDLSVVALRSANLDNAYLESAGLVEADLRNASMKEAFLRGANLSGANMFFVDLTRANLRNADLWGADLTRARLNKANLYMADLMDSNLINADGWTVEQFSQAKNLEGATMPDGIRLGSTSTSGPTFDEWKAQYIMEDGQEAEGTLPE